MKQYIKYLLKTLKVFGIITLILSPILAISLTTIYFKNLYLLLLFIPYIVFLIPYLAIIVGKYEEI